MKSVALWVGIAGSIASIVGLAMYFAPATPKIEARASGTGAVSVAGIKASGPVSVTIGEQPQGPLTVVPMSHEVFWEAITRADIGTLERLAKDGMKLKPEDLPQYFGRYFTPDTFEALHRHSALPAAGCPSEAHLLEFYLVAESV